MKIKQLIKDIYRKLLSHIFRNIVIFPFIKSYPRGREHIYEIIVNEKKATGFIIIDVGANVGQTAHYYTRNLKRPKIYSIEPVNETFSKLQKNVKEFLNVSCYNLALGAKKEKVNIVLSHQSLNNSLKKEVYSKLNSTKTEAINVDTLDDFMSENRIETIDVLKIDTEGFDLEVLKGGQRGLSKNKIRYVFCEVGFNNEADKVDFGEVNSFLKKFGFEFCGLYDVKRKGDNFISVEYANALFKNKNLAGKLK